MCQQSLGHHRQSEVGEPGLRCLRYMLSTPGTIGLIVSRAHVVSYVELSEELTSRARY